MNYEDLIAKIGRREPVTDREIEQALQEHQIGAFEGYKLAGYSNGRAEQLSGVDVDSARRDIYQALGRLKKFRVVRNVTYEQVVEAIDRDDAERLGRNSDDPWEATGLHVWDKIDDETFVTDEVTDAE